MPRAMRIRSASWPLQALSLATLVALIVTPACASFCAGQNCPRAHASAAADGSCHRAGAMQHEAPQARAFLTCSSPELPAIVLTRTPLGDASGVARLRMPDGIFLADQLENFAPPAHFSDFYFGRPHDFSSRFAAARPSVLRI